MHFVYQLHQPWVRVDGGGVWGIELSAKFSKSRAFYIFSFRGSNKPLPRSRCIVLRNKMHETLEIGKSSLGRGIPSLYPSLHTTLSWLDPLLFSVNSQNVVKEMWTTSRCGQGLKGSGRACTATACSGCNYYENATHQLRNVIKTQINFAKSQGLQKRMA